MRPWFKSPAPLFVATAAVAVATASAAFTVHAQPYPNKPIKLIAPYAVGQGTDISARFVGDELSKALGQAIVIDNRPGRGVNLGTQIAARSAPDGYTIMIGTNATHPANTFLFTNPGFDAQADFEPIAMVGILPLVSVAALDSPVRNFQDLIKAAKAKPNGLNTAVSTTTCRMAHELFTQRAEAPMFPVDFKGSAQAITALIGGPIEFMVDTITSCARSRPAGKSTHLA